MVVLDPKRPGRVELAGLRDFLLFLCGEAPELRLELALLDAGGGEGPVQLLADGLRAACDAPDVLHVALVTRVLAARGAATCKHDEQDDGEDEKSDQPCEPEHRDDARGRANRA